MSNKSQGTKFERQLSEIMARGGYWVHLLNSSVNGQPSDILAIREKGYLIDAKDCERDIFELSRIEDNQRSSMIIFKRRTGTPGLFALNTSAGIYLISLDLLDEYKKNGISKLDLTEIKKQLPINDFIKNGF